MRPAVLLCDMHLTSAQSLCNCLCSIDEAWIYQNEAEVGRALEDKIKEVVVKREDVWITSKLWNNFHRADLVKKGVLESMAQLKVSYLDLYLIHFPVSFR